MYHTNMLTHHHKKGIIIKGLFMNKTFKDDEKLLHSNSNQLEIIELLKNIDDKLNLICNYIFIYNTRKNISYEILTEKDFEYNKK